MTQGYMRYPTAARNSGTLTAQVSEAIAPGGAQTIRVRNQSGATITIIGAQGFCTALSDGGATLDIQDNVAASHLGAAINLAAGTRVSTTTITGAAGGTVADGDDIYYVFSNIAGAGNMTDAQGTVTYTVEHLAS